MTLLFAGATAMALAAVAVANVEATVARPTTSVDAAARSSRPSVRERLRGRSIAASSGPMHRDRFSGSDVDDARPRLDVHADAALDASALVRFDAAFAEQSRDPEWGRATERAIRAILRDTAGAPVLEHVECKTTLCRVELRGSAETLPTTAPFDGIVWWLAGEDGRAQLLVVRDDAEIPLPAEE